MLIFFRLFNTKELATQGQFLLALRIDQPAEMADADKSPGQNVQEKAPNELLGVQGHAFLLVCGSVIFPAEGHFAILKADQPVIRDGNAVGIAAQVAQHLVRAAEGWLGVDHPFDSAAGLHQTCKGVGIVQFLKRTVEVELSRGTRLLQAAEEYPSEKATEYAHGKEEFRATANPAATVHRQAAAGDDAMQVRVMLQVLPPGVQYGEEADPGTKVFGISGDAAQGFRATASNDGWIV